MAPIRLQCLKSGRQIIGSGLAQKAAFSTSKIACAEDLVRRRSPADALAGLGRPQPTRESNPSLFENPIRSSLRSLPRSNESLLNVIGESTRKRHPNERNSTTASMYETFQNRKLATDLTKQITRRWRAGEIYAPHDLSSVEMMKWKKRRRPDADVFDILAFNPRDHYKNFSVVSDYMTEMGRIKHSKDTGLRPVNQRRIARTIRRAIGIGLMPSVHRHPEVLQRHAQKKTMITAWKDDRPM